MEWIPRQKISLKVYLSTHRYTLVHRCKKISATCLCQRMLTLYHVMERKFISLMLSGLWPSSPSWTFQQNRGGTGHVLCSGLEIYCTWHYYGWPSHASSQERSLGVFSGRFLRYLHLRSLTTPVFPPLSTSISSISGQRIPAIVFSTPPHPPFILFQFMATRRNVQLIRLVHSTRNFKGSERIILLT